MQDVEKNDVDLSQLFTYRSKLLLRIPGTEEDITIYQRVVGDEFVNRARVYALRESGEFRENLNNKKWKDRIAFIPSLDRIKKAEIIDLIINLDIHEMTGEIINEFDFPYPSIPDSDASLEEQEEFQKLVDEYPGKYSSAVGKKVEKEIKGRRKFLSKYLKEELKNFYETAVINKRSSEKFLQAYQEMTAFFGTFTDEDYTTPAYSSFEDFQNAPQTLKKALIDNYDEMEIEAGQVKKSPGVTQ